jgi:hypothetical protein
MAAIVEKVAPVLLDVLKRIFPFSHEKQTLKSAKPAPQQAPVSFFPYTPEQHSELEALLAQLFTKKALITSGKLQMLGFEEVKKKMGENWPSLQAVVFKIADEVIRAHVTKGDIYLPYKDDTYILVFAQATHEEGRRRTTCIADEIGRRLAETRREQLRIIQVNAHVCELKTSTLEGQSLDATMAAISSAAQGEPEIALKPARISSEASTPVKPPPKIHKCSYFPLWDVPQKALTTYLSNLEEKDGLTPLDRDIETLRAAKLELQRMYRDGRRFTLIVPVRHGTLYNTDSSQKYQMLYRDIPEEQRKFLIFLIVNFMEGLPRSSAFWFLPALKASCRHIFAEVPLRAKASLAALGALGFDGLGVVVDPQTDEVATIRLLTDFSEQARMVAIPRIFVLNVPTRSLATSASCMGFTYIAGPAIHPPVPAPDNTYRYRYEDLFSGTKP